MSDDEELPQGDMGNMGMDDDMSDDGDGMDLNPPADLPDGITKEVVTPAPSENYKKPKVGDEVSVHYVGTLQSDGSEFDSSRSRGDPFVFTLGKGQVIKGWDLGVATMKKGELAKFTLAPDFAYGESGSPPKIPANATLVFEVELLSWASKDDLFGDEGVIKTQLKEGSGWKNPKSGDEVLIAVDGKADIEYIVGSESLGAIGKACDKALLGMKKGEEASLKCGQDHGNCTVNLTLQEIFETKDVSFVSDKTMIKKQVMEGEGYDKPNDGAKVTLSVESATDGVAALSGFSAKVLEFTAANGEVCDALEAVVADMKKGEKAILTVTAPKSAAEAQLGLQNLTAEKVVFKLELQDFEKGKETWDMSEDDKVAFGEARKSVATDLFKSGRFAMALGRYKKVSDLFNYIDNFKDENKTKAKDLKKACELNKAACYLKLSDWIEANKACAEVLKSDSQNVKALYRKAQAQCSLKNYSECISDCKRVVELDAQNKDARVLLKKAQAGQKEEDKKSKGLFANMCKALGKGPIPEPYKAKPQFDGMDEDDDDDNEEQESKEVIAPDENSPPTKTEDVEKAEAPTEAGA